MLLFRSGARLQAMHAARGADGALGAAGCADAWPACWRSTRISSKRSQGFKCESGESAPLRRQDEKNSNHGPQRLRTQAHGRFTNPRPSSACYRGLKGAAMAATLAGGLANGSRTRALRWQEETRSRAGGPNGHPTRAGSRSDPRAGRAKGRPGRARSPQRRGRESFVEHFPRLR